MARTKPKLKSPMLFVLVTGDGHALLDRVRDERESAERNLAVLVAYYPGLRMVEYVPAPLRRRKRKAKVK